LILIVALIPIVLVFGITLPREYRIAGSRETTNFVDLTVATATDIPAATTDFLTGLDTAMLDDLAIMMRVVPDTIDYRHGVAHFEALSRPIPRSVWPTKPTVPEVDLMNALWPSLSHVTLFYFSIFGEAYLDGGALGVVIFGLAFGAFWGYLWRALRPQFNRPIAVALYAASLPFMVLYLRGGVGGDYYRQVIFIAPMLALVAFSALRGPIGEVPTSLIPRQARGDALNQRSGVLDS
jgi:hypothetical protein